MQTKTRLICRPIVLIAVLLAGLLATPVRAQAPPATFTRVISTSSQSLTVDFALHPIRNANFAVLVQQSDGNFSNFTPDVPRTYLGTVQGRPGAIACGLLRADGTLLARIGFEDGTTWTTTGGTASADGSGFTPAWPTSVVGAGGAGSNVHAAEYGFDSTFNHFTACGGTAAGVLEQIEFSAMSANMVYLRDAGILHRIGKVIVRADQAQDPYVTDNDTNKLLTRIGPIWNAGTPMGTTHDLAAVLHSAVNGGLAWVGAVGTSNRYSANDSDANGDFSVVWRHEAGHNWGSSHYEGGGNPEGSTIMSNNSLSRFSSSELARIIAHRNSQTAFLDNLGAYSFPLPPRANQDAAPYLVTGTTKIDVLANDSDSNGEALSLLSFDSASAFGGTLSRSTGTGPGGRDEILYTPPAVLTSGADWFTYRIQDASGMQAVGYAMLRPTSEIVTPVDHWTLDDSTGTTAVNRIRTAQNGTHQNGVVVNQSGANGVTRKGASFDGTNDRTSIPAPGYNTNTLTFTTWVKRDGSQAQYAPLVFTRAGSSVAGLHFGLANELRYHWDGVGYTWNSGITVPDNTWCLAVMCVSPTGTTLHLRTPTSLQSATNSASQAAEAFNGTMYLGHDPNAGSPRRFKGWLDDVRVYKSTLTATQVESLYQEALSAPSIQLTAPTAGSSVSPLNVSLAAGVTTLAAITARVDFVENESSLASASGAPWTAQLAALAPGAHSLTARATYGDWGYQIDSAPVSFTALAAPLPVVTVTASLPASKRGPIPGSFTFTRSHPIGSITVPFTLAGTAVAGTDYTAIPNDVTIPDGSLSQTITVDPIAASPDDISETLTLTLASGAGYSLGSPSAATLTIADHITSIASGEWDLGTTWNSGVPAPTSGTQNTGDVYAVAHTITSNDSASNSQALVAKSLRIQSGGVLDLNRVHNSGGETISYNLPSTAVEDGGILQFRCSNGSSVHSLSAALSFAGSTTLKITAGNYDNDANFSGVLTGSGTISVVSDTSAGNTYVRQVSVNSPNNPFTGNWTINHTGGGTQSTALRAGAANALGTGTVTVGTRARLINDNATGLNSLAGIVLNGTNATLQLNQPWTNPSASLSLTGGSPLVQLGNAASSIGNLSGQLGTIQGSGASSSLTVNQTTDREFTAGLGTNLRFTKAGPASLTLAGSLDPSLAITLANGALVFSNASVISSFSQSGGSLKMDLPSSPASVPLTVSGNYARTGGTINVDVSSIPQADVPYTLLLYQGSLTGTPSVTVNDTSGSGLVATVSNGTGNNSSITVVFSMPQYTLTYSAGSGGAISGQAVQVVTQGNNGTAVTAVPDAGYHFVSWSDGGTTDSRTDANVTADLTVSAIFQQDNPDANGNGILDAWETVKFGNANPGGNAASGDADGDGICNLMEYALDTDPLVPNTSPLSHGLEIVSGTSHLRLVVPKNPAATNLTYTVETCGSLDDWSAADTVVESSSITQLVVRDTVGVTSATRRFIRLSVAVLP